MQVINYILETKDSSLITLNNLNEEYFSDYKNEFNFTTICVKACIKVGSILRPL